MKQKLFIVLLLSMTFCDLDAQKMTEIVYLKNGSAIHGMVIEQIPGETVKIKTADGSIFVYKMDEVEKITKEEKKKKNVFLLDKGLPQKGYKGFVDLGYDIGTGDWGEDHIEFTTSHGYQFLPYLFAGIGAGVSYWFDTETVAIPIFANIRGNAPTGSLASPFLDVKLGYSPYDIKGFYGSFALGCRFAVSRNCGINVDVGYQIQRAEAVVYLLNSYLTGTVSSSAITLKVGFDF